MLVARHFRLLLLSAALFLAAGAQPLPAQVYEGRELVRAEVLANATAAVPGRPFTVGVLLKMVPHWHTYWKFPGDAGIPSEIKWNLPPGWKVGEIQWPIPLKLLEPGDIQIYGYHDEVLLMQEITPPAGGTASPQRRSTGGGGRRCSKNQITRRGAWHFELTPAPPAPPASQE